MPISEQILKSPCFVHSQLEKGASLAEWLKKTHLSGPVTVAKSLGNATSVTSNPPADSPTLIDDDDEEGFGNSLTRQLAETAVSVREMSKALGEHRVAKR
jgi:NAD+ kinase